MIDVFFAGTRLQGSPFVSQAYDPSLVRITDVDKTAKKEREIAFTGESVFFIDALLVKIFPNVDA